MKIALWSDLHMECGNDRPSVHPDADVIVLAGDCSARTGGVDLAQYYQRTYQVPVILLLGNHEYYGKEYHTRLAQLRVDAATALEVHLLECDVEVVGTTRFLGCTLWSSFLLNGAAARAEHQKLSQRYVADFSRIHKGDRLLVPEDITAIFEQSYAWLEQELAKPWNGKTVVVTHFAPHRAAIHPQFLEGPKPDPLTPYFVSDCSALMQRFSIDAWLYGHTHHSVDVIVEGKTRLVSNQFGYPGERFSYTQYREDFLIELED